MSLNRFTFSVAMQQRIWHNGIVSSTLLQQVDLAQSQQVAPFFCYHSRLFSDSDVMKTFSAKAEDVVHGWFVVDAQNKVLGRLASQIAMRLRGKHKPEYTPHVDTGDFIVVLNAAKIRVTGRKTLGKKYFRHTNYPGGIKETDFAKLHARFPDRALQRAVKGMLPKGPLGYAMLRKLKIYADGKHPHSAQQPKVLEI